MAVIAPSQKCVDDEEPDEDCGRMPKSEKAITAIYVEQRLTTKNGGDNVYIL